MSGWALPAAAAAFGLGVLAAGDRVAPRLGAMALLLGATLLVVRLASGARREASSSLLLAAAGLVGRVEPAGERERILAAAGLPTGPRGPPDPSRRWRAVALVCGFLLLGGGWQMVRRATAPSLGALDGRHVEFRATAAGDLRRYEFGWGLEATVERVADEGGARAASLRVWLSGGYPAPRVEAGVPVAGSGRIESLRDQAGFGRYLASRGLVGIVSVSRVEVLGPPRSMPMRAANGARAAFRRAAFAVLPGREAALLLGLSIGDTERMHREVEEDFRATGLGHLLAVSGSNVALFLAPVLSLAAALRLPRPLRLVAGAVAVAFFVLVTRWEPSVLRAGAMAGLGLAALWAGRPRSTAGALGAAVLVLLAADPGLAASLGFQLSVAATAGLAAMAGPLAARLRWLPRPLALAAAATLSAQIAVSPLLLLHFGVVPTVTVLANLLAAPAVAPALFGGLAAAGAQMAWPGAGRPLGHLATLPLEYLAVVADRLARFPLPAVVGTAPALPLAAAALAALCAWRVRRGRRPVGLAAVAIAVAALGFAPSAGPIGGHGLTVTFLDVGQGDAAVIRSPGGATVLIDAGPEEDEVALDLARLGVRRLDLAAASHAHADHVEGFPAVLARFPVSVFLDPGCPAESPSYRRLLAALDDEGVTVRHPRGGDRFVVGDLVVDVLGPDRCAHAEGPNDDSLVLRIAVGGGSVLFPGDAEVAAQQDLLDDGDAVAADVLKVPHHGGDTSLPAFFEAARASMGVVSVGDNDYGHPVPSVLASLRSAGMAVLRTDLEGDVTLRVSGRGVLVESAAA
ncbi:MAG TPA: ComEC/Rec2 family competence protein [Actinomycetota bacterium]|nr:ComEC/Rec2 family competence protein [Actinomycetota bacterium]